MKFQGCFTALVTPFADGQVAFDALTSLVNAQIMGGVDGVVPVGTTGESPTLNMVEHLKVIEHVVGVVDGRCLVVAGTGANATDEALELTRKAKELGADATLQVTPYYNKPTQEGLYRHFSAVADIGLPVILYNIPGRCGISIAVETVERLAAHEHIAAVKEAGGSADRVSQIRRVCDLPILSGDDVLTLPMMAVGAAGVISVASNVVPAEVTQMAHLALDGDFTSARSIHYRLYDFFNALFTETNPIPVKAALAMQGRIQEEYRLPLTPMADANREILRQAMERAGLLDTELDGGTSE